jgi:uncharacterized protein (DUF885 family)
MPPMAAHDELMTVCDEYWDGFLAAYPSAATLLGDRRFDDRIEDLSAEAEQLLHDSWAGQMARLDSIDVASLDRTDRVTHGLLRTELTRGIEGLAERRTEMASDQMDGVHAMLLTLAPQITAPTPESARALVERHRQMGTMLDQAVERFRSGLAAGRVPARLTIDRSLHQLDGYLASPVDQDPFVTFAGPEGWDGESAWRDELADVARSVIRPALQRYRDVLADELLPVARPDDCCGRIWLDEGESLYRSDIRHDTTLDDLTAEEIHQLGLDEIERLRGEYTEVGERLFGTSDLEAIFDRLRNDPELRYRDGDQIVADARGCLDAAKAVMGNWFGRLPRSECQLEKVPEFLAADAPKAYYVPPPADGSRPGTYYVNTWKPAEDNRYEVASVAFHEAIPGHHLQLTIALELEGRPRFQRMSLGNTAFVEGWALYAERLAEEMGLYRDDVDRIGMLVGDSWRSARLVVDTGLHAKGWSRRQAIDYVVANVPVSVSAIEVEIDRYVAIPGQALSYKVGQLEIQRQRRQAEQAQGAAFDIKAFHDTVLGSGTISLPVLRQLFA